MFCPQRYNNFNSPIAGYNQRSDHTLTDIRGLSDQLQSRSAGVTHLLYDLSYICTIPPIVTSLVLMADLRSANY